MSVACQWARRDLALLSLLGGWAHFEWEKSAVSTSGYWGGQEGMQCTASSVTGKRQVLAGGAPVVLRKRLRVQLCGEEIKDLAGRDAHKMYLCHRSRNLRLMHLRESSSRKHPPISHVKILSFPSLPRKATPPF